LNTPFYHSSNSAQKEPHGSFGVECSRSEHHVDGITQETLVEVPPQSMICLAVPYDRLYSYSLAEEPLFFLFRVWRVACLWNTGYHDVRLSNAMAELHEFCRYAKLGDSEGFHSAKILVVGVLRELFHDALVRDVANMLQHYKTHHQADRLGHASVVLTVQGGKGTLKGFPIYQIGKFIHWMGGIKHG